MHSEGLRVTALMGRVKDEGKDVLALLINSTLEARWLPHSRQVKTLPCRVHRKVVRHAASHTFADVQAGQSPRGARWHHLQVLCEDAPHATLAWTPGALPDD